MVAPSDRGVVYLAGAEEQGRVPRPSVREGCDRVLLPALLSATPGTDQKGSEPRG